MYIINLLHFTQRCVYNIGDFSFQFSQELIPINSTLKARYDLHCAESAIKRVDNDLPKATEDYQHRRSLQKRLYPLPTAKYKHCTYFNKCNVLHYLLMPS